MQHTPTPDAVHKAGGDRDQTAQGRQVARRLQNALVVRWSGALRSSRSTRR